MAFTIIIHRYEDERDFLKKPLKSVKSDISFVIRFVEEMCCKEITSLSSMSHLFIYIVHATSRHF